MSPSEASPNLSLRIAASTGWVDEFVWRLSLQFRLVGMRETQGGNRRHTAARAETTGYGRASRRAVDWQPPDRSGSAVGCRALRRCALATRFRQWSARRPFRLNI